jgi:hypothetical protein
VPVAVVLAAAAIAWFAQALALSRLMNSRGFHPLPYFAVPLLIGPAFWPLALLDLLSGPPAPRLVRRGRRGGDGPEVLVALERDELAEKMAEEVARVLPRASRLVVARVLRAGGPSALEGDAERFLLSAATALHAPDAELDIVYGCFDSAVARVQKRGGFSVVLRSDQPDELFDRDGSRQEMRCLRDVQAA